MSGTSSGGQKVEKKGTVSRRTGKSKREGTGLHGQRANSRRGGRRYESGLGLPQNKAETSASCQGTGVRGGSEPGCTRGRKRGPAGTHTLLLAEGDTRGQQKEKKATFPEEKSKSKVPRRPSDFLKSLRQVRSQLPG